MKRKRKSNISAEVITGLKGEGVRNAGYTSISAIQQGMVSARDNSGYLNLPGNQPQSRYSNPSDVHQPIVGEQYDQASLAQLNAEADQHMQAQLSANQQGLASSQRGQYINSPAAQSKRLYSDPRDVVSPSYAEQFDQVSLSQMNQEVTNYSGANLNRMHAGYNDIGIRR